MFHWVLNMPLIWLIRLQNITDAKMMSLQAWIIATDIKNEKYEDYIASSYKRLKIRGSSFFTFFGFINLGVKWMV